MAKRSKRKRRLPKVTVAACPRAKLDDALEIIKRERNSNSENRSIIDIRRIAMPCCDDAVRDVLREGVVSILHAHGLAQDGSKRSAIWWRLAAAEPDNQEVVNGIIGAVNAVDPIAAARRDPLVAPRLSRMLCNRWSARWRRESREDALSIQTVEWAALSEAEQEEITLMLLDLEGYERGLIRPGAPRQSSLDGALAELADLFLSLTGSDRWPIDPRYAERSRFIRFAHLALGAADPDLTARAVSRRWARRIRDMKLARADLEAPDND